MKDMSADKLLKQLTESYSEMEEEGNLMHRGKPLPLSEEDDIVDDMAGDREDFIGDTEAPVPPDSNFPMDVEDPDYGMEDVPGEEPADGFEDEGPEEDPFYSNVNVNVLNNTSAKKFIDHCLTSGDLASGTKAAKDFRNWLARFVNSYTND